MFINLTPHKVVVDPNGHRREFAASGTIARVTEMAEVSGIISGIQIFDLEFGEIVDLPEPKEDTIYIVSALVKNAAKAAGRTDDLVSPYGLVRDDAGQPIGCKGFAR